MYIEVTIIIAKNSCKYVLISFFMTGTVWGAQWPKDVAVISPAPGASVHMVLVGVGKVVPKYTPIENWIVQPLGGPKLWLPMMREGKCDFANHNAADILNAFLGRGLYSKMGPQPVRTVAAGHDYMFGFWTIPDTGIRGVGDLKGKVVYNKFKNAATQTVTTEKLLPVEFAAFSKHGKEEVKEEDKYLSDFSFEPSKGKILFDLIPRAVKTQLYRSMLDSQASEHGARMVAMDSATENAGEPLNDLKLQYNQARQAAITKEILEIVGGAAALEG